MNKFDGLMNANSQKRYKSFVTTVADVEQVWLDCDPENATLAAGDLISVWPEEMFATAVCLQSNVYSVEVHEFCEILASHPDVLIRVFPNGKDYVETTAGELLEDIEEELDLLE